MTFDSHHRQEALVAMLDEVGERSRRGLVLDALGDMDKSAQTKALQAMLTHTDEMTRGLLIDQIFSPLRR